MKHSHLISIIVPIFNVEKYLVNCIESIISQTYKNLEIILVDDGSSDKSGDICDDYALKDSRILVVHKKNEGVAIARLIGFEKSIGELVTFIDADDFVDKKYVEKLVAPFDKYEIDLCACNYSVIKNDIILHYERLAQGFMSRKEIDDMLHSYYLLAPGLNYAGFPIFLCTKMIRREFVSDALKYGLGLWWGEDQVASFHILLNIKALYALNEPLYNYVQHVSQVTKVYKSTIWHNQFECWRRYKELDKRNLLEKQLQERMWWTIKRNFIKMNNSIHSFKEFKKEMSIFDQNSEWKEMLTNMSLPKGKREYISFFFLRNRLYYPFYKLLLHRL